MFSLYDPATLALIAAAMLAAGFVKGVTGLGLPLVSLGLITIFLPIKEVLGIIILPLMLTNIWQVVAVRGTLAPLRRFWPMLVAMLGGLAVGAQLVVGLDASWLYLVVGGIVTVFTALGFMHPTMRLSPRAEVPGGVAIGAVAGICGGIGGIWGPPISMYLLALDLKKDDFIGTVGLVWFLGALPLGLFYALNGIVGSHNVMYSAAACIPSVAGLLVGQRIRRRIPQESFRKVLMATLFVIGLNLIRRAIF